MDLNATAPAPWSSVPAAQPALGLLYGVVNMLVHAHITDLPDLGDYELGELRQHYDYVIVGGGSAGCVIANRLSADPSVTVLLLEAGGLEEASRQIPAFAPFHMRGRDDWDYWSVPQKHAAFSFRNQRLAHSRGKMLGGSSGLNFMMYTRGNPGDYDRWAREYGAEGWSYEDVLPHFKDIEDYRVGPVDEYHGTGGEIPVDYANASSRLTHLLMEACEQAGYAHVDYNGPTQSGCSRLQTNVANGERFSASKAFIQPIVRARKNLHVALLSHVTKVNFDGKRAVGVTFIRLGRPRSVTARREVILSAGTVGSAQLLLLSGVGPREDLERLQIPVVADLPVGRNLQDHPALVLGVPVSTDVDVGIPPLSFADIQQYAFNRTGTISIPVNNEFLQFLHTEYAEHPNVPDIEVATFGTSPATQLLKAVAVELGLLPEAFDSLIGPADGRHGFRAVTILNRPRSRGSISLRSKNPFDHPNIDPNMMEHPYDAKALAQGSKIFIDRILSTDAMKSIGAKPWGVTFQPCADAGPLWSQEYIECLSRHTTIAAWHLCCTAAMGSHPEAVLDERLRVRGNVTGLRVADASVMPDIITDKTASDADECGTESTSEVHTLLVESQGAPHLHGGHDNNAGTLSRATASAGGNCTAVRPRASRENEALLRAPTTQCAERIYTAASRSSAANRLRDVADMTGSRALTPMCDVFERQRSVIALVVQPNGALRRRSQARGFCRRRLKPVRLSKKTPLAKRTPRWFASEDEDSELEAYPGLWSEHRRSCSRSRSRERTWSGQPVVQPRPRSQSRPGNQQQQHPIQMEDSAKAAKGPLAQSKSQHNQVSWAQVASHTAKPNSPKKAPTPITQNPEYLKIVEENRALKSSLAELRAEFEAFRRSVAHNNTNAHTQADTNRQAITATAHTQAETSSPTTTLDQVAQNVQRLFAEIHTLKRHVDDSIASVRAGLRKRTSVSPGAPTRGPKGMDATDSDSGIHG
ncbi:hypothetical protein HPB49_016394 [Dermacentor silvarum]|uniref:Uncharacterized protein n=1 Tax=Dermacentor silvarum TaxID=543639 RepID=A0ACB8DEL6_DERSI|nr:hypothetical protein HPB49_016394 [Dermacentor silvarum]